jgi:hypothetical protein
MIFRNYDPDRDKEAVRRIWFEIGWIDKEKTEVLDLFVESGRAMVAEIHGEAECLVTTTPGTIRYLEQDMPLCAVTGVSTSRVARKQGLASRLTARMVAEDAAEGALVAGLGMFEQGFYNQLGFGTGGYEHWVGYDPARLNVGVKARVPRRITTDDWEYVHASLLARKRGHGACNLLPAHVTRAEMLWGSKAFGLGYYDGPDGELTHHAWFSTREVESGPYSVHWTAYQTWDQFLELMALIRNLGDQVHLVRMREPGEIQLQDLIEQPFKQRAMSDKSKFSSGIRTSAYWQVRICDLVGCMENTCLRSREEVRFNLVLSDPIQRLLGEDAPWRGIGGNYVVTLGPISGAERGEDGGLPTLTASVGAFTRLWLGVRPATGLAVTDELAAPPDLLDRLDWVLRLPEPKLDWDF